MSGRGDNNKKGSAGRGASNQSMQGMQGGEPHEKANHRKEESSGQRSQPQKKSGDQSANRNTSLDREES